MKRKQTTSKAPVKAAKKGAGKPAKTPVKSKAKTCGKPKTPAKKGTTAVQSVRAQKPAGKNGAKPTRPAKDVFEGATSVEVLPNTIAVTRRTSKSKNGSYTAQEKREYVERTEGNMRKLNALMQGKGVKKVRIDFRSSK